MTPTQRQVSKLRLLVEEGDPDLLLSVVHLARSLDDPEVVDALLEGATWDKRRLEPGTLLGRVRATRHHAQMATLGLISTGIGTRARTLRDQIDRLELTRSYRDRDGNSQVHDPATPVDLRLLAGIPLRTLRVNGLALQHAEHLRDFEIESLVVDSIDAEHLQGLSSLRTLVCGIRGDVVPTLPACEELQLNAIGPLRIEPQPSLLTLTMWNSQVRLSAAPLLHRAEMKQAVELIADEPLPALRHLHIAGAIRTPERLIALEDLRTGSLEGVAELPALRRLELEGSYTTLAALKSIEVEVFRGTDSSLTTLEGYPRSKGTPHRKLPALRSLRGIEAMRDIETLQLRSVESLAGIEPLRDGLRGLDIRDCDVRDVGVLEGFDLRAILIAGTTLKTSSFPPSLRWAVVTDRKASVAALAMREPPS